MGGQPPPSPPVSLEPLTRNPSISHPYRAPSQLGPVVNRLSTAINRFGMEGYKFPHPPPTHPLRIRINHSTSPGRDTDPPPPSPVPSIHFDLGICTTSPLPIPIPSLDHLEQASCVCSAHIYVCLSVQNHHMHTRIYNWIYACVVPSHLHTYRHTYIHSTYRVTPVRPL